MRTDTELLSFTSGKTPEKLRKIKVVVTSGNQKRGAKRSKVSKVKE